MVEYYKKLAEIREIENDAILSASKQLLYASGITYQMIKDIEAFGDRVGRNEKYKAGIDRVLDLDQIISGFSIINDKCYILRQLLKNSLIDQDVLIQKNKDLTQEIENLTKSFDDE